MSSSSSRMRRLRRVLRRVYDALETFEGAVQDPALAAQASHASPRGGAGAVSLGDLRMSQLDRLCDAATTDDTATTAATTAAPTPHRARSRRRQTRADRRRGRGDHDDDEDDDDDDDDDEEDGGDLGGDLGDDGMGFARGDDAIYGDDDSMSEGSFQSARSDFEDDGGDDDGHDDGDGDAAAGTAGRTASSSLSRSASRSRSRSHRQQQQQQQRRRRRRRHHSQRGEPHATHRAAETEAAHSHHKKDGADEEPAVASPTPTAASGPPLYERARELALRGDVPCRTDRTEETGCADRTDFLARLHCVREASNVMMAEQEFRQWFIRFGRELMGTLIAKGGGDLTAFHESYDDMMAFVDEVTTQGWAAPSLSVCVSALNSALFA